MPVGNSGFDSHKKPQTTDWEEHAAQGDVSSGKRFKKVQVLPNSMYIDQPGGGVIYIGDTKPGTATSSNLWRIKRIYESGTLISITFPNGDDGFNYAWDNRASYSYS